MFSIQLDESTAVATCAAGLCEVCSDGDVKDEVSVLQTSWNNYCTRCIWHIGFISERAEEKISWEKVCSVCTDGGAPAMLGCPSGFQCSVPNESPKAIGAHWMIRWQILATKTKSHELQEVMKSAVNFCQFCKGEHLTVQRVPTKFCYFTQSCEVNGCPEEMF